MGTVQSIPGCGGGRQRGCGGGTAEAKATRSGEGEGKAAASTADASTGGVSLLQEFSPFTPRGTKLQHDAENMATEQTAENTATTEQTETTAMFRKWHGDLPGNDQGEQTDQVEEKEEQKEKAEATRGAEKKEGVESSGGSGGGGGGVAAGDKAPENAKVAVAESTTAVKPAGLTRQMSVVKGECPGFKKKGYSPFGKKRCKNCGEKKKDHLRG